MLDKDILEQLDSMGFEKETATKNILNARYNQMTATYYLLVLQKRKAAAAAKGLLTSQSTSATTHPAPVAGGSSRLKSAGRFGPLKQGALQAATTITTTAVPEHSVEESKEVVVEEENEGIAPLKAEENSETLGEGQLPGHRSMSRRLSSTIQLKVMPSTFIRRRTNSASAQDAPDPASLSAEGISPSGTARVKVSSQLHTPPLVRRASVSLANHLGGTHTPPTELSMMQSSDLLNDLPGANPDIRAMRFAFNSATTTSHTPAQIAVHIEKTLKANHLTFTQDRFMYTCTLDEPHLRFEMEICRLPNLHNFYGIRFKRIAGESNEYKLMYAKIVQELSL